MISVIGCEAFLKGITYQTNKIPSELAVDERYRTPTTLANADDTSNVLLTSWKREKAGFNVLRIEPLFVMPTKSASHTAGGKGDPGQSCSSTKRG